MTQESEENKRDRVRWNDLSEVDRVLKQLEEEERLERSRKKHP